MPATATLKLLRECGIPTMGYAARVARPTPAVEERLEQWDNRVRSVIAAKLQLTAQEMEQSLEQIAMLMAFGGLGIRESTGVQHSIAHLASVLQTAHDLSPAPPARKSRSWPLPPVE